MLLRKKFKTIKLRTNEELEAYLSLFEDLERQMRAVGIALQDQELVCSLLMSLPKTYTNCVERCKYNILGNCESATVGF